MISLDVLPVILMKLMSQFLYRLSADFRGSLGGFGHIWFEIPNTGCWICLQSCRCDYPGSVGSIEARYLSVWCGGMFGTVPNIPPHYTDRYLASILPTLPG